ncbi:MAG: hypothetical protein EHM41_04745 [Chloroflexi bacterium]|nr:MAG: hypothetical protein EHM41_04745 [Chloroflexota bacterium]
MRSHEQNKTHYWLQEVEDEQIITKIPVKKQSKPVQKSNQVRARLAEELYKEEDEYKFTYQAARHEQQWISTALREFYADSIILDVLSMVKGGKEANVYCCQAHPNIGLDYLAAKVYRPRLLRNLKNDSLYKEGRSLIGEDGKTLRDGRSMRAVRKKTRIGEQISITSWIEHEFLAMSILFDAGGAVPRPVAQTGNAVLMEFIGENGSPAPALSEVALDREEAGPIFQKLLENVELMLAHDRIHADLSAYNVLYWEGDVTIIDFPQVVDPLYNPQGYKLLARDLERLCQYFYRYGIRKNPHQLATDMWSRYLHKEIM